MLTNRLVCRAAVGFLTAAALFWGGGGIALAAPFSVGDVFVAVANGEVQHYTSGGALLETLNTGQGGFTTGMAFDATGNLYVTNFSVNSVSKFTGPGDPHTPSIFANIGGNPESIVFDAVGNAYISSSSTGLITKVNSGGTTLFTLNTGGRADWIDLNAANTKLLFTQDISKGVGILDIASNTTDPPLSGTFGNFALRILADGTVLVANRQDIKHLDSLGGLLQSYDLPGEDNWFALNLDPDGVTFWSADFGTADFCRFNIATAASLGCFNTGTGGNTVFGLAVFGEIVAGCPTCGGGGEVPEPMTLMLLGSGLIAAAGARSLKKKLRRR